ncbi:MAG TPA: hypothetical protein VFI76_03185 [Terrimicrobiaceae bacterium]|nr:hypothetical protein [Terrimicrobiaceae bacterium]
MRRSSPVPPFARVKNPPLPADLVRQEPQHGVKLAHCGEHLRPLGFVLGLTSGGRGLYPGTLLDRLDFGAEAPSDDLRGAAPKAAFSSRIAWRAASSSFAASIIAILCSTGGGSSSAGIP